MRKKSSQKNDEEREKSKKRHGKEHDQTKEIQCGKKRKELKETTGKHQAQHNTPFLF